MLLSGTLEACEHAKDAISAFGRALRRSVVAPACWKFKRPEQNLLIVLSAFKPPVQAGNADAESGKCARALLQQAELTLHKLCYDAKG